MPRTRRISPDNVVQHVLNRGNRRQAIFKKAADYEHFIGLMGEALESAPMRILAFCLMPNHWHMVVWPEAGSDLPAYMERLLNLHVRNHHAHYGTTGEGHVYQGRYHNFLVQDGAHVFSVLRYVEANALTAGLARRAEEWRWSSAARGMTREGRALLAGWPLPRPSNWLSYVNAGIPAGELYELRRAARRGSPYGDSGWIVATAKEHGLEATLNPPHRPRRSEIVQPAGEFI